MDHKNVYLEKIKRCWLPDDTEDVSVIYELAKNYSDESLAFAVFTSGTVVFSDHREYVSDDLFINTLFEFIKHPPSVSMMNMKDGNYLVRFHSTVSGIVSRSFYMDNRDFIIENLNANGLVEGEFITQDGKVIMRYGSHILPSDRNYVPLYARARVFKDILNPKIAMRFDASK